MYLRLPVRPVACQLQYSFFVPPEVVDVGEPVLPPPLVPPPFPLFPFGVDELLLPL